MVGGSAGLTFRSVLRHDGHRLSGVLESGGGLFMCGVPEVHAVHLQRKVNHHQRPATYCHCW